MERSVFRTILETLIQIAHSPLLAEGGQRQRRRGYYTRCRVSVEQNWTVARS